MTDTGNFQTNVDIHDALELIDCGALDLDKAFERIIWVNHVTLGSIPMDATPEEKFGPTTIPARPAHSVPVVVQRAISCGLVAFRWALDGEGYDDCGSPTLFYNDAMRDGKKRLAKAGVVLQ